MTQLLERPVSTEPAGKVCPLCGGAGEQWGEKDGYRLRVCDCIPPGILLSWQFASVAEYERQYQGDYHTDGQRREGQLPSLARDTEHLTAARVRLEMLRQWMPPPASLLDVGCGAGAFVAAARAFGYDAAGIEPCFEIGEFGRRLGRNIITGGWKDLAGRACGKIICLHDVAEHLTGPQACLETFGRRLPPGGLLIVEWPEFEAPFGGWQKHIRPLQHVTLWSDGAARELFRRCGLRVEMSYRPLRGELGKITYWVSPS